MRKRLIGLLVSLTLALTAGVAAAGPAWAAPDPPTKTDTAKGDATKIQAAKTKAAREKAARAAAQRKATAAARARAAAAAKAKAAAAARTRAILESGPKAAAAARAATAAQRAVAPARARAAAAARNAAVVKARAVAAAKAAAAAKARSAAVAKSKAPKKQNTAAKAAAKTAAKAAAAAGKANAAAAKASAVAGRAAALAQANAVAKANAATAARLAYIGYAKQRADLAAKAARTASGASARASKSAKAAGARYKSSAKTTSKAKTKATAANKKAAPYRKKIAATGAIATQARTQSTAATAAAKAAAKELKDAQKAVKKARKKSAKVRAAAAARAAAATARATATAAAARTAATRAAATGTAYAAAVASGRAPIAAATAATSRYQVSARTTAAARSTAARTSAAAKSAKTAAARATKSAASLKKAAGPNATWAPSDYMTFNNLKGSKADRYRIISDFNKAIKSVPAGGQIRMAMYLFDVRSVADNLIAADKRGVSVQIVIDGEETNKQIRKVKRALGKNKRSRSFVATCDHSCMSKAASVIHAKYYLFSVAGQRKYVSMISSANPYTGNTSLSWNNNHVIVADRVIYDSLNRYFLDMIKDKSNRKYFRTTTSGKYKIFLYPQTPKKTNDVVWMNALNQVTCKTGKGYGTADGRTLIRVANWGWSSPRIDVAKRLVQLQAQGCNVQVMVNRGRITKPVLKTLLTRTKRGQIPVYDAWRDSNNDGFASRYVHHKMMTINGRMAGRDVKITWTGSQNFTGPGTLTNTDLVLRIVDPKVTAAYEKNFAYIRGKATKRMKKVPWAVGRTGLALL
ncbi:hypothetical protein GCM10022204_12760 [Microlunatus aurantiacus]|uniref:phospholipase D n=1 Tax=Microlunatus aurantiacus TaxID=446786 RepID=A0ABP7D117_9ACTN